MKIQLLPSSFESNGCSSPRQHLTTFMVDDRVSIDAGSLGFAVSDAQRRQVRDVVLTHAHLDHIAGLPLFIDDLFSELREPVRIHAAASVIEVLERDIFNWSVYPRFSELANSFGPVVEYHTLMPGKTAEVAHLRVTPIEVNHKVPATGFVISDGKSTVALSGDTSEMDRFWCRIGEIEDLSALFVECAFPNELEELAMSSFHMTPMRLERELRKFSFPECPVFVVNLKPRFRDETVRQLDAIGIDRLEVLQVGRVYDL